MNLNDLFQPCQTLPLGYATARASCHVIRHQPITSRQDSSSQRSLYIHNSSPALFWRHTPPINFRLRSGIINLRFLFLQYRFYRHQRSVRQTTDLGIIRIILHTRETAILSRLGLTVRRLSLFLTSFPSCPPPKKKNPHPWTDHEKNCC